MYETFYGLREKPFSILPDPDFLFWAEAHSNAFAMLEYGVLANTGITVITGEVGAGKTTLIRYLLGQLPETIAIGLLSNVQPGRGTLLEWVMMALGQELSSSYVNMYRQFQDLLVRNYASGCRTVLIVDEAQNLDIPSLEELRMMSNINSDKDFLLQVILSGQPELRQRLSRPELLQFAQRITSDYHLRALKREEVVDYIHSRTLIAGPPRPLFTAQACGAIYEASKGIPRLINALCDRCLTYGFAEGSKIIEKNIIDLVLDDKIHYGSLQP